MKVIALPRGGGKTTELIKLSAEKGYYIIASSRPMARWAVELAEKMGLHIPFPITYDDFLSGRYSGLNIPGFLIDDAEKLLLRLIDRRIPVMAIAISSGEDS